jgi:hypothetical protein
MRRFIILELGDEWTEKDVEALRRDPLGFAGWTTDSWTGHEDYPRVLPVRLRFEWPPVQAKPPVDN